MREEKFLYLFPLDNDFIETWIPSDIIKIVTNKVEYIDYLSIDEFIKRYAKKIKYIKTNISKTKWEMDIDFLRTLLSRDDLDHITIDWLSEPLTIEIYLNINKEDLFK